MSRKRPRATPACCQGKRRGPGLSLVESSVILKSLASPMSNFQQAHFLPSLPTRSLSQIAMLPRTFLVNRDWRCALPCQRASSVVDVASIQHRAPLIVQAKSPCASKDHCCGSEQHSHTITFPINAGHSCSLCTLPSSPSSYSPLCQRANLCSKSLFVVQYSAQRQRPCMYMEGHLIKPEPSKFQRAL
jgi:hypothetical protein